MAARREAVPMVPRIMNTREVANYLCASEGTVTMWAKMPADPLPSIMFPNTRTRRFDRDEVDAWIDRRKQ